MIKISLVNSLVPRTTWSFTFCIAIELKYFSVFRNLPSTKDKRRNENKTMIPKTHIEIKPKKKKIR